MVWPLQALNMHPGQQEESKQIPSPSTMEDSLARLIQAVGEAAYFTDRKTEIVTWIGDGHEELLGLDSEPFTLSQWQASLSQHSMKGRSEHLTRDQAVEAFWEGEMTDWESEFCFHRPNGTTRWVRNHLVPLYGPDGKVTGGAGVLRDIQKRVDREKALAEAEARSRAIIESAPVGIHIYESDEEGVLRFAGWNSAAEALTGHNYSDLVGKEIHHAFKLHKKTQIAAHYLRLAKEGGTWEGSIVWSPEPGRTLHHEISAFASEPGRVVTFFTDVTEKKESAQLLEHSEQKFRGLVEAISEAVITVTAAGIVTYASPAISNLVESPVESIVGHNFADLVAPEHAPLMDRAMNRASLGMCEPFEFKILQSSGERRWVRALCQQVLENGKFIGINGILLDINDRKKSESSLLAAEEKLRILLDATAGRVAVVDIEGRVTFASPMWYRELGYQAEGELLGKSGFTFICAESEAEARRIVTDCLNGCPTTVKGVLKFISEHEIVITVEMEVTPMLDNPLIEGLVCRMLVLDRHPLHSAA